MTRELKMAKSAIEIEDEAVATATASYVWKSRHKLGFPRIIRDGTRTRLAYWACYLSTACLAVTAVVAAASWDLENRRLVFYQLMSSFDGRLAISTLSTLSTMICCTFFVGRYWRNQWCSQRILMRTR